MFAIPDADTLVQFLLNFTGSSDENEIKECIFMAEMSMRNIELPALRTNPYETFGTVGPNQLMPIPADMNKPILFFQQGNNYVVTSATATGVLGQFNITLTSVPGYNLQVGMTVTGEGIGNGATISQITSPTNVILNVANSGTVNGLINFATQYGANGGSGPWIVYDRIGDRDIITMSMVAQFFLTPVNVPVVIRGKFSEVGQNYQFLPYLAEGAIVNLYYYKAWNLLFTPAEQQIIFSATGTIGSVAGLSATISGLTSTTDLAPGDIITATDGTGSLGDNVVTVNTIINSTSITALFSDSTPTAGTITDVSRYEPTTVQTNPVLQTWPEGYVYNSLHEYYVKRHSEVDAQIYKQKAIDAWKTVEDQNNLGKWSGGHTKLTSVFQPRRQWNYATR
jgi:hypothetical protein